jgi:hypothetical protein
MLFHSMAFVTLQKVVVERKNITNGIEKHFVLWLRRRAAKVCKNTKVRRKDMVVSGVSMG